MKTAEDYLKEVFRYESGKQATDNLTAEEWAVIKAWHPIKPIIEAMKAYALAAIEADRKDCAEKAKANFVDIDGPDEECCIPSLGCEVDKDSILNRPYPELK